MIISCNRATDATSEPVTLADAQAFLRVSSTDDAAEISALITAARNMVEEYTGRAILTQTWKLTASEWPVFTRFGIANVIELPRTPLASVTSVKYYPADGGPQATWHASNYYVFAGCEPGVLVVSELSDLPDLAVRPDAVEITFTAGAATAPASLRQAVLFLLVHLYEQRAPVNVGNIANEMPMSLRHILDSQRVGWLA